MLPAECSRRASQWSFQINSAAKDGKYGEWRIPEAPDY
jgi:hypothetical protein